MESKSILVVDDEESLRLLVSNALTHKGFEVITANDGEDGFNKALQHNPHVIVADVMMPKMNGYKMVHALRESGNTSYIIFLTAKAKSNDLIKGFTVEGDDFLAKPFQMPELIARIKAGFRLKQAQFDLEKANRKLHETVKERDRLINLIATQLRDPINEINSYLKLLTEGTLSIETVRDVCQLRTDKIMRMINNICEMDEIENQHVNIHFSRTDISEIVQEMALHFEKIFKKKQIGIDYNIISKIYVHTDKALISEVVSSILFGAFQIAEPDSIIELNLNNTRTGVKFEVTVKGGPNTSILPEIFDSILDFTSNNFKWNEILDISTFFGLRISHKLISMLGGLLLLERNLNNESINMGFILRQLDNTKTIFSAALNGNSAQDIGSGV